MKDIFKLTQQPVSEELKEIINELSQGKDVSLERIENTQEVMMGKSIKEGSGSTPTYLLKHREPLQCYIAQKMDSYGSFSGIGSVSKEPTYEAPVKREYRLDVVIGLPASGKSSSVVNPISQAHGSKLLDNDEAKKFIPEYNNGWGAGIVHKESQDILSGAFVSSLDRGENIVYPRVGGNYEDIMRDIRLAKDCGYTVYLHYVELDKNRAQGRILSRFVETGRFFDPDVIATKYVVNGINLVEDSYEKFKNAPEIDGYSKWDNNEKVNGKPVLVEVSESLAQDKFIIENEPVKSANLDDTTKDLAYNKDEPNKDVQENDTITLK